eukprot:1152526-Pelagomonas_calceolata.AAC.8
MHAVLLVHPAFTLADPIGSLGYLSLSSPAAAHNNHTTQSHHNDRNHVTTINNTRTLISLVIQPVLELRRYGIAHEVGCNRQDTAALLFCRSSACCARARFGGGAGGNWTGMQDTVLGSSVAAKEGEGGIKTVQLDLRVSER